MYKDVTRECTHRKVNFHLRGPKIHVYSLTQ